jgi:hypothetical protein
MLGAECAAIFAIFTSQAWNMAFSFYQSLRTVPAEFEEVARSFQLSPWQKFWQLETPFAMPGLIYNMMMSMSGGWFFVVASEAITVGDTSIKLPGIGAWLAAAIDERRIDAVIERQKQLAAQGKITGDALARSMAIAADTIFIVNKETLENVHVRQISERLAGIAKFDKIIRRSGGGSEQSVSNLGHESGDVFLRLPGEVFQNRTFIAYHAAKVFRIKIVQPFVIGAGNVRVDCAIT